MKSFPLLPVSGRNMIAARTLIGVHRAVWKPSFWTSITLARDAQKRGAMQKVRELAPLIALVRQRRPRVVVEIGTARGGTFYAWCKIADPSALLVSIDLPGGRYGGGYSEDDEDAFRRYGSDGQELRFIRADSRAERTQHELEELLAGRPIEFLFIDGDHTYDGVKEDFTAYAPLVGSGCLIAFHDIVPHPLDSDCEVERFWAEIKHGHVHKEFVDTHPDRSQSRYGGVGVLFQS